MAKQIGSLKISGKITGMTGVDSTAYGPHIRRNRGTVKPAKLNDAMQQSGEKTATANQLAKVIKDAIEPFRAEIKDGTMWSRLVGFFKKQLNDSGDVDYSALENFELHKKSKFAYVLTAKNEISHSDGILSINVHSRSHIKLDKDKADQYQQTIVVVFLSENSTATVTSEMKMLQLKPPIPRQHLMTCSVPAQSVLALVFIKCIFFTGTTPVGFATRKGMQLVKVVPLLSI